MSGAIIDRFILRLNGKISNSDLKIVYNIADIFFDDYDIKLKETLPMPVDSDIYFELNAYCATLKIENYSEKTIAQYRRTNNMLISFLQKSPIDISTNDIRKYLYEYQRVKQIKDSTLESQMIYIRSFFNWLVKNDYIIKNPFTPIKIAKRTFIERKALTDEELEKLRSACEDIRDRAMVEALFSTGCRVNELCNIKLSDIYFDRKEILVLGKGRKERTVYLSDTAIVHIKEYLKWRIGESEYLFCGKRFPYKRLSTRSVEIIIHRLGVEAGIQDKLHPHKMRRTMATKAFKRGMPIAEVSKILGHTNISTTMRYIELDNNDLKLNHAKYIV